MIWVAVFLVRGNLAVNFYHLLYHVLHGFVASLSSGNPRRLFGACLLVFDVANGYERDRAVFEVTAIRFLVDQNIALAATVNYFWIVIWRVFHVLIYSCPALGVESGSGCDLLDGSPSSSQQPRSSNNCDTEAI